MKNTLLLLLLISILASCNQPIYRSVRNPAPPATQESSLDRLRRKPLVAYKPKVDTRIYEVRGYRVAADSVLQPYDKIVRTPQGILIAIDGKFGMISHDGERVIPAVFERLDNFEEAASSFISAKVEPGRHYFKSTILTGRGIGLRKAMGIIDDNGHIIIPHQYFSISHDGLAGSPYGVYREINDAGEELKKYEPYVPRGKRVKRLKDGYMTILSEEDDTLLTPKKMLIYYQPEFDTYYVIKTQEGKKINALLGPDLNKICEGDFGGSGHLRYIQTHAGKTVQDWQTGIFDQKERRWVIEPRPWYYEPSFGVFGYWLARPIGGKLGGAKELINHKGEVTVSLEDYDNIVPLNRGFPYVVGKKGGRSRLLRLDGTEVFPMGKYIYSAPAGNFIVKTAIPPDTVKYVSKAKTMTELAQERLEIHQANQAKYPRKVGFFHPFTEAFIAPRFEDRYTIIVPLEEYEVKEGGKTYRVVHEKGEYVVREK